MKFPKQPTCKTCCYCFEEDEECRINPPFSSRNAYPFPPIYPNQWCGKHSHFADYLENIQSYHHAARRFDCPNCEQTLWFANDRIDGEGVVYCSACNTTFGCKFVAENQKGEG